MSFAKLPHLKLFFLFVLVGLWVFGAYQLAMLHDLNLDELLALNLVLKRTFFEALGWIRLSDTFQPIYYFILYSLKETVGLDLFWVKLPGLIFAVLSLGFSYWSSRQLTWTLLLAGSFMFIYHGIEVRPYSMALFFALCAQTFYYQILVLRKRGYAILGYALCALLLVCSHLSGFILIFCHFLGSGLSLLRKIPKRGRWLLGVALLPSLYSAIRIANHYHPYRNPPSLYDFFGQLAHLYNGVYFVILGGILALWFFTFKSSRREQLYYLSSLILPPILLYLKSVVSAPAFEVRYLLFTLPVFLWLLSRAIWSLPTGNTLKLGFIAIFLCLQANYFFHHEAFHQRPYRADTIGASQQVTEWVEQYDPVIVSCGICLSYYLRGMPAKYDCFGLLKDPSHYLVYLELEKNRSFCHGWNYLDERYPLIESRQFQGIEVKLFGKEKEAR